MKKSTGFTLIELLVVVVLFFTMCGLFLYQKSNFEATSRDDRRKADINALHHNLEKIYFKEHEHYPDSLTPKTLTGLPDDLFKDPAGIAINELRPDDNLLGTATRSTYTYEAKDCSEGKCNGYVLRADLELEDDYVKESR